jgi:hypothetical protein
VNIWCRDRAIEAAREPRVTPGERVLLDEIVATQEIITNLLYAIWTEDKSSAERLLQIASTAHAAKHGEAGKILEAGAPRPEMNLTSGVKS